MYPKQPWAVGATTALKHPYHPVGRFETAIHVGTSNSPGNRIATVHLGGEGAATDTREAVEATAARIVACVNACAEMDSVVLAAWKLQGRTIRKELDDGQSAVIDLQQQRDTLFAALRGLADLYREKFGADSNAPEFREAEAAIASVTEDIQEERNT